MKKSGKRWEISLPFIITILLFGGFYSFSVYLVGAIILLLLFWRLGNQKKSRVAKSELFYGSILLCASALVSVMAGVNKGMAWYGFLRVLVFAVWLFYLMQFSAEERDEVLTVIPWSGGAVVLIGILSLLLSKIWPVVGALFWQAKRLGGTFQYSNTCALFLLIGMLVLAGQQQIGKKELALFDVLLVGIFLTGSKGGILLLIPVFLWIIIKQKAFRKNGILVISMLVVASLVYGYISGDFQNIARIYTILQYPSTLLGRLLYMKDALPVLLTHPLGIGYMGYAGMQGTIQTGVYTSLFVHNDWMQMGLDYGWLFMIASVGIVVCQLKRGKQETWKKIALFLICSYSLLDFHFQYLSIVMVLPLLMDFKENSVIEKKAIVAKENQIFALIGAVIFGYFAVASLGTYMRKYEVAISMFPYDTNAMEALLLEETDKESAKDLAKDILNLDKDNAQAYNTLAYAALMDGEYERALEYKLEVLKREKYNMAQYADFISIVETIKSVPQVEAAFCEKKMQEMQALLAETKEQTSEIAYYLRDKPEFVIPNVSEE